MRLDYQRVMGTTSGELDDDFRGLLEEYDRGGLPFERALTRLSYARWLLSGGDVVRAREVGNAIIAIAERHGMTIMAADGWEILADCLGDENRTASSRVARAREWRVKAGYCSTARP